MMNQESITSMLEALAEHLENNDEAQGEMYFQRLLEDLNRATTPLQRRAKGDSSRPPILPFPHLHERLLKVLEMARNAERSFCNGEMSQAAAEIRKAASVLSGPAAPKGE